MAALFRADDKFIIRGRGLVLAGRVVEGTLRVGMTIRIEAFPRELAIDGFEMISSGGELHNLLGLFFQSTDPDEIALWKSLAIKGMMFEAREPDRHP